MKRLFALLLCLGLCGCATTSSVTPNLSLGMTKQEVIAKCGNPTQAGAIQGKDGKAYETFMYREEGLITARDSIITTYVYFADGKVIYYGGNPNMPTEETEGQKK